MRLLKLPWSKSKGRQCQKTSTSSQRVIEVQVHIAYKKKPGTKDSRLDGSLWVQQFSISLPNSISKKVLKKKIKRCSPTPRSAVQFLNGSQKGVGTFAKRLRTIYVVNLSQSFAIDYAKEANFAIETLYFILPKLCTLLINTLLSSVYVYPLSDLE